MFLPLLAFNAGMVGLVGLLTLGRPADAKYEPPPPPSRPDVPSWLPRNNLSLALSSLDAPALHGRLPSSVGRISARGAVIADLDRGEILWARRPDAVQPVASLTKMVAGLALVSLADEPVLSTTYCVTPEMWGLRPGARSSFETGGCHQGWEFLGAALVHSDNRGAMALPVVADVPFGAFVEAMDEVSADLGMMSTWADPTGLEDNNLASARDMLKAVVAVGAHPTLAPVASAPSWTITRDERDIPLTSTNRLRDRYEVLAAKTGYTDTAKYGFATVVRTKKGQHLAVAVLGAPNSAARFADADRLLAWAAGLDADEEAAAGSVAAVE